MLAGLLPDGVLRLGTTGPDPRTVARDEVLVGADGAFSATRDAVFGHRFRPVAVGETVWRGWVDSSPVHDGHGASETWGDGALFGITQRAGGQLNWFAAARADHATSSLDDLYARFGGWHAQVRDVLERLDPATVLHHELHRSVPLGAYHRGRVVLVGDAAHAMGPHLGRGAGEALVDGVVLARALASRPTAEALCYDRARRLRTRALVRASDLAGRVALLGRGAPVRDAVLTGVGRLPRPGAR